MIKTTSLELSKQLKEAGFPQESRFIWQYELLIKDAQLMDTEHWLGRDFSRFEYYAAPTAEEILERLPHKLDFGDGIPKWLVMEKQATIYTIGYQADSKYGYVDGHIEENTLVEAAGKMWLYLQKNKRFYR